MYWLLLFPLAACMFASGMLSYSPAGRASPWFMPAVALSSVATGLMWCFACRAAGDGRQLFSFSMAWDAVTLVTYSLVPLFVFGIRLTPAAWLGLAMVVAGAAVVKLGE